MPENISTATKEEEEWSKNKYEIRKRHWRCVRWRRSSCCVYKSNNFSACVLISCTFFSVLHFDLAVHKFCSFFSLFFLFASARKTCVAIVMKYAKKNEEMKTREKQIKFTSNGRWYIFCEKWEICCDCKHYGNRRNNIKMLEYHSIFHSHALLPISRVFTFSLSAFVRARSLAHRHFNEFHEWKVKMNLNSLTESKRNGIKCNKQYGKMGFLTKPTPIIAWLSLSIQRQYRHRLVNSFALHLQIGFFYAISVQIGWAPNRNFIQNILTTLDSLITRTSQKKAKRNTPDVTIFVSSFPFFRFFFLVVVPF